jgi:ribosomal protein L20A (L18A)
MLDDLPVLAMRAQEAVVEAFLPNLGSHHRVGRRIRIQSDLERIEELSLFV